MHACACVCVLVSVSATGWSDVCSGASIISTLIIYALCFLRCVCELIMYMFACVCSWDCMLQTHSAYYEAFSHFIY